MKRILLTVLLAVSFLSSQAQKGLLYNRFYITGSLSVGKESRDEFADPSAWFDIGADTTSKGVMMPKVILDSVSTTGRALFVYDLQDSVLFHFDGSTKVRYMTYRDTVLIKTLIAENTVEPDSSIYSTVTRLSDTATYNRAYADSLFLYVAGSHDSLIKYADTTALIPTLTTLLDTAAQIRSNFPEPVDTSSLSSRIDIKVSYSDSTGFLPTKTFLLNSYVKHTGNSLGEDLEAGTNDGYGLYFITNNVRRFYLNSTGDFMFGAFVDNGYKYQFYGDYVYTEYSIVTDEDATINGITVGEGNYANGFNTAIGRDALASNVSGSRNFAGGTSSLSALTSGSDNISIGQYSMGFADNCGGNVSIGRSVMTNSDGANDNTIQGYQAGTSITSGDANCYSGRDAGRSTTSGSYNSGFGNSALRNLTTKVYCSGLGRDAGYNCNGTGVTAIGAFSLYGASGIYTSNYNTGLGYQAGYNLTGSSSYNNTFIGYRSGFYMTTGHYNAILGGFQGSGFETVSNHLFLSDGQGNNRMWFDASGVAEISNIPTVTAYDSVLVLDGGKIKKALSKISASATLDFPSTSANDLSDLTISVTGAAVGDVVALGCPNVSAVDGVFMAFISATDTVTVRFHPTSGGAENPPSGTYSVIIIK